VDTDLCIIGGGAAGITLAKQFIGTQRDVLFLESGGFIYEAGPQLLYRGKTQLWHGNKGRFEDYLINSRLRYFGGSINHWMGYCRPLDEIDFEKRDWVANSGWPFGSAALEPFYSKAAILCEIAHFGYDNQVVFEKLLPGHFSIQSKRIQTRIFHQSSPTRFGQKYRQELGDSANIRILLNTNAIRLVSTQVGKSIRELTVGSLGGKRFTVRARNYVLACGAVENVCVLFNSKVGNDVVGRYFMEHPQGIIGLLLMNVKEDRMKFFQPTGVENKIFSCPVKVVFAPTYFAQKEFRSLNFYAELLKSRMEVDLDQMGGVDLRGLSRFKEGSFYELGLYNEQSPNPESRVTLVWEKDDLGLHRVDLNAKVTALDNQSLKSSINLLAQELGKSGSGRMRILSDRYSAWENSGGSNH